MDESIRQRCLAIGRYMVDRQTTVRQAAAVFGISKSSVHKDLGSRLPAIDPDLADAAAAVMAHNRAVCHLRGGEATRLRYAARRALHSGP